MNKILPIFLCIIYYTIISTAINLLWMHGGTVAAFFIVAALYKSHPKLFFKKEE